MKVEGESEVTQLSLTPSNPMDCSLPGSSIHGIFQAKVLEWGAIAFSKGQHTSAHSLVPWTERKSRGFLPPVGSETMACLEGH